MSKHKLYLDTDRPLEPSHSDESPEEWVEVLCWEESKADYFEWRDANLSNAVEEALLILQDSESEAAVLATFLLEQTLVNLEMMEAEV